MRRTFSYCPDCHKKGVELHLRSHGEDNYGCRYCGFSFFICPPLDPVDHQWRAAWERENVRARAFPYRPESAGAGSSSRSAASTAHSASGASNIGT